MTRSSVLDAVRTAILTIEFYTILCRKIFLLFRFYILLIVEFNHLFLRSCVLATESWFVQLQLDFIPLRTLSIYWFSVWMMILNLRSPCFYIMHFDVDTSFLDHFDFACCYEYFHFDSILQIWSFCFLPRFDPCKITLV